MTRPCESLPAMMASRLRSGQPITQSPSISGLGILSLSPFLRSHTGLALRAELGLQPRLQRFDELAEVRPRLAWIDEILDRESLRGAEGRRELPQLFLDLALARARIRRAFD